MLNKFSNIVDLFFMSTYMQVIKMTMFFFLFSTPLNPSNSTVYPLEVLNKLRRVGASLIVYQFFRFCYVCQDAKNSHNPHIIVVDIDVERILQFDWLKIW